MTKTDHELQEKAFCVIDLAHTTDFLLKLTDVYWSRSVHQLLKVTPNKDPGESGRAISVATQQHMTTGPSSREMLVEPVPHTDGKMGWCTIL